jgi:cytochrome P450
VQSLAVLHTDADRRGFYAEAPEGRIVHDRAARCWVVTGTAHCEALLRSRNLAMPPFEEGYAVLESRYGLAFPNLLFASRYLPLCNNGEAHQRSRRLMAARIAATRGAVSAALPGLVERHAAVLRPGEVELMEAFVEPLVTAVTAIITGTRITDLEPTRHVGRIFDRLMGMRLRQRMDEHMAAVRAMIRASAPELSEEEEGVRLAFFVFGQDTVIGTIGGTFHRMLELEPGGRLDRIAFPAVPCETGVPYAERVVTAPFSHGGVDFAAGDLVRLMVQEFAYADDPRDAARLFGLGLHACLGRQLALELWQRITERLCRLALSWHLVGYELRDDFLMFRPTQLKVRFS